MNKSIQQLADQGVMNQQLPLTDTTELDVALFLEELERDLTVAIDQVNQGLGRPVREVFAEYGL